MKNIKTSSKLVKKNDIFICLHDKTRDNHIYIKDAENKNASAIIVDKDINYKTNIPLIKVNNTNETIYQIANDYYNKPFETLDLIGITGTDGKTTTATITAKILSNFYVTSYLGTNGYTIKEKKLNTSNTTPGIVDIIKYASISKDNEAKYMVMEVSSEGLLHNRCNNLKFKISILTNITKDHLNIHKNLKNYISTKKELFKKITKDGVSILNIDDKYYKYFKNINKNVVTYGKNNKADFCFSDIVLLKDETIFNLKYKSKKYTIKTSLIGEFNVYNLVASIACCTSLGIDIENVLKYTNTKFNIPGRLNFIKNNLGINIIVDYAHTEKATLEIFKLINQIKTGKIITVVGCAGEKYKEKRAIIGKIVSNNSNYAIFTEDDSRCENINDILNDIVKNIKTKNYTKIINRKSAIKKAITLANKGDTILILGKGNDRYILKNNKKIPFNDIKVIKRILLFKHKN